MQTRELKKLFRVGVSGHRDLKYSELDDYKNVLSNILIKLIKQHPYYEIILVTTLAEGADRLVIESAIELGLRYEVVLPMNIVLYKDDFDSDSSIEFNKYFVNAAGSFTIPLVKNNTFEKITHHGDERNRQYQYAGKEIVDRSSHMIFLYDGVDNGLIGGTSDILRYANNINKSYNIIECKREYRGD
jgi:hypothetical protein